MAIGMRKAINEKCKDCIYDPASGLGTWRQQTEGCTSTTCPLYPLRPVSATGDVALSRKATFKANNPDWQPPSHIPTGSGQRGRLEPRNGPTMETSASAVAPVA